MANLTADRFDMEWTCDTPVFQEFSVKATSPMFKGSGLCREAADGYARLVAASLTNPSFLGFAERAVTSQASSGLVTVLCRVWDILKMPVANLSGVAITDLDKTVYMSDDSTFTLTSTNNVAIGKLVNLTATHIYLLIEAASIRSV